MKLLIKSVLLAIIITTSQAQAQEKYMTKEGHIKFFSSALVEDIEADNHKVQSIIDIAKKEVVISITMHDFQFEKSLMQEHFNENYVESEKFPKATFKGVFTSDKDFVLNKDGEYQVELVGEITIHGVTKPLKTKGVIKMVGSQLEAQTTFELSVADFDIEIPKLLFQNIAEVVKVTVNFKYDAL